MKRRPPLWLFLVLSFAIPQIVHCQQAPSSAGAANLPVPTRPGGTALTRGQAEAIALKNNPQITVGKLRVLEAGQDVRAQRSALMPTAYLSLTAVDASDTSVDSRVEGFEGSSSRMILIISVIAASRSRLASIGRSPVSISYRMTPSE